MEVVEVDVEGNIEINGVLDRVVVIDLVFEVEYVGGINIEFGYFGFVGGESNEVFGDIIFVVGFFKEL